MTQRANEPTPSTERIAAIDVLRGFALFGVFLVNMPFMAMPSAWSELPAGLDAPLVDFLAWAGIKTFFEMKFVTIFSLLFGMGLILQMERMEAGGRPFAGVYLRRLAILGALGLLHGFLLYVGDILYVYAFVGLFLFLCRKLAPRILVTIGVVFFVVGVGLSSIMLQLIDGEEPAAVTEQALQQVRDASGPGEIITLVEENLSALELVAAKEGPLRLTLFVRGFIYVFWLITSSLISFNWRIVAMFFFGAAIMKRRLLSADHRPLHLKVCALGLGFGGAAEILVTWVDVAVDPARGLLRGASILTNEIASLALSLGFVSGVVLIVHSGALPRLARGLAAVGRMALTNYLTQSILTNVLFYWYGFGLYGELTHAQLAITVVAVFSLQILASVLWLRRFRMGPFEWAWRSLTYGKLQRFAADA